MKKNNPQNIYHYVIMVMIIGIVSIILIGSYLYFFCYNAIYSEFMSGNKQYVASIEKSHEDDMEVVESVVHQMNMAGDVTRFLLKDEPEKASTLKASLNSYTATSSFYNMILYHYLEDDRVYNHSTSISIDLLLDEEMILENTSMEVFTDLLTGKAGYFHIIPEQQIRSVWLEPYVGKNKKTTMIVRTINADKDEVLVFFVPDAYYDRLLSGEIFNRDMSFLYKNGQMVVFRGDEELAGEELRTLLMEKNFEGLLEENSILQQEITLKGTSYLLSITKGKSGICYAVVQDKEKFYDNLWSDQMIIVMLVMTSITIVVIGVIFLSRCVVRRVKKINELLYEKERYDLESIEYGIQALIIEGEEKEKMNLSLKKVAFIRRFIQGELQEREKAIVEAGKIQLNIDYDKYFVVLLRQEEVNCERKVYDLLLTAIEESDGVSGYGSHLVGQNQDLFVLFGNDTDILEEILKKMFEIETEWGQNFVMAASDYHTDFKDASKAYLEADTAFDHHMVLIGGKIIRFQNIVQKSYADLLPDNSWQRLKKAIYDSDRKAIDILVKEIYNVIKNENVSLYSLRIFYNKILQMLISEWNGEVSVFEKFYNVFSLTQCTDLHDFCDLLSDVCNMLIDSNINKKVEHSDIVQRAHLYMKEHFGEPDLTVNFLANYLNVSPVSLSINFKNEMTIGPSEYLANLRLEKAKELLCNTDMRIKEISVAVGYYDEGSFSRRFKKDTGVTPMQYRMNYSK